MMDAFGVHREIMTLGCRVRNWVVRGLTAAGSRYSRQNDWDWVVSCHQPGKQAVRLC